MNARAAGFTLVEMLIVTVLGALVMGSIYQMIMIQDRTTRQQYAIVQNNQNARMALSVLTADLKEVSSRDSDIYEADSTVIGFRAMRKAGLACSVNGGSNHMDVNVLGEPFAAGDSVVVFVDGASAVSMNDDSWRALAVNSVASATCDSNPLAAATTQRLTFGSGALANVMPGALVRSFVRTRYQLVDNGEFAEIQRSEGSAAAVPIIDGIAPIADGGLRLRYIDSTSAVIPYSSLGTAGARRNQIMRIEVKVRGKAEPRISTTGNRYSDSLVTQVYVRGNGRSR